MCLWEEVSSGSSYSVILVTPFLPPFFFFLLLMHALAWDVAHAGLLLSYIEISGRCLVEGALSWTLMGGMTGTQDYGARGEMERNKTDIMPITP